MAEVTPVNLAEIQPVQLPVKTETADTKKVCENPLYYDCTNLYSPEEIQRILERVGAPKAAFPSKYSVTLFDSGTLVIKNESMTNDIIEISKDGGVRHVGSWHNNQLAPKDSFKDIVEEAKQRLDNSEKSKKQMIY